MSFHFFAIVQTEDRERTVQRIRVKRQLQRELAGMFEAQGSEFVREDFERVAFDPRHTAGSDELHVIHDFMLPEPVSRAISYPGQPDDLQLRRATSLKAVFAADSSTERRQVYFQSFSKARLLVGGSTVLSARHIPES